MLLLLQQPPSQLHWLYFIYWPTWLNGGQRKKEREKERLIETDGGGKEAVKNPKAYQNTHTKNWGCFPSQRATGNGGLKPVKKERKRKKCANTKKKEEHFWAACWCSGWTQQTLAKATKRYTQTSRARQKYSAALWPIVELAAAAAAESKRLSNDCGGRACQLENLRNAHTEQKKKRKKAPSPLISVRAAAVSYCHTLSY